VSDGGRGGERESARARTHARARTTMCQRLGVREHLGSEGESVVHWHLSE
jgi:hypothetical protein